MARHTTALRQVRGDHRHQRGAAMMTRATRAGAWMPSGNCKFAVALPRYPCVRVDAASDSSASAPSSGYPCGRGRKVTGRIFDRLNFAPVESGRAQLARFFGRVGRDDDHQRRDFLRSVRCCESVICTPHIRRNFKSQSLGGRTLKMRRGGHVEAEIRAVSWLMRSVIVR